MCKSELHDFLRALPKCEHHIHLEGALTPQLLFNLASKNGVTLPAEDGAFASVGHLQERYNRFVSLDDFLHYYYIGMSVLITASDFEALAWDYFQHASTDGVVHVELFFDPQAHLTRGVQYNFIMAGFTAARNRAMSELGISSELICCFLRHLPVSDSLVTFDLEDLQASFRRGDIAGIGLDSSEKEFPPELFQELFRKAKMLGMRRTAHAGEEGPAAYIESAMENLDVQRIDHGIQLASDPDLLMRVAERGIMLSICPVSNVFLRCVSTVAEIPIRKFLDAGVAFSINSDDPAYFGGNYLLDNYCAVEDAFSLNTSEWETIAKASIRGSWCSDQRRSELLARLQEVVDEWKGGT